MLNSNARARYAGGSKEQDPPYGSPYTWGQVLFFRPAGLGHAVDNPTPLTGRRYRDGP